MHTIQARSILSAQKGANLCRGLHRDCVRCRLLDHTAGSVVQIPLAAMDDRLCRLIEPDICPTSRRVGILKALQAAGIPTVVWLCPVLPWLNDTEENIRAIVETCADAGVRGILCFGMGQPHRDPSRGYYTRQDRCFPGLKDRAIRPHTSAHELRAPHSRQLEALFHRLCADHGILHDNDRIFDWMSRLEGSDQLTHLDRRSHEDHDPYGKHHPIPRIDTGAWPESVRGSGRPSLPL